jgi:hypothetical protein
VTAKFAGVPTQTVVDVGPPPLLGGVQAPYPLPARASKSTMPGKNLIIPTKRRNETAIAMPDKGCSLGGEHSEFIGFFKN